MACDCGSTRRGHVWGERRRSRRNLHYTTLVHGEVGFHARNGRLGFSPLRVQGAPGYPPSGYLFPGGARIQARSREKRELAPLIRGSSRRRSPCPPHTIPNAGGRCRDTARLRIPALLGQGRRQPSGPDGPRTLQNPGRPRITGRKFPSRCCLPGPPWVIAALVCGRGAGALSLRGSLCPRPPQGRLLLPGAPENGYVLG